MMERPPVLIVDDDPGIRAMMVEILSLEGYPVATAANGQEALNFLAAHPGHYLIITGLMMPVMNGWEFLGRLEAMPEERAKHKVLVVSAMLALSPYDNLHVDGRLSKPFTSDELLNAITTVCAA